MISATGAANAIATAARSLDGAPSTREAATRALLDVLGDGSSSLSAGDLRRIADLVELPDGIRPAGLDPDHWLLEPARYRHVADQLDAGIHPNPTWDAFERLNRIRAQAAFPTRHAATERLAWLASIPREQLTAGDLRTLDGIRQLPEQVRPAFIDSLVPTAEQAERIGRGEPLHHIDTVTIAAQLHVAQLAARWPTRAQAVDALRVALGSSNDDLTPGALRILDDLSNLPGGLRPAGLDDLPHGVGARLASEAELQDVPVTHLATETARFSTWPIYAEDTQEALDQLDRLRAMHAPRTRDAASTILQRIARTPVEELTTADLRTVEALRDLPADARPDGIDGFPPVGDVINRLDYDDSLLPNWPGWARLDDIALERGARPSATDQERLRAILLTAAQSASQGDAATGANLAGLVHKYAADVPTELAGFAQTTRAAELLREYRRAGIGEASGPQQALRATDQLLRTAAADPDPAVANLARDTQPLVARNLDRTRGALIDGYAGWADIGELGEIASRVELLRHAFAQRAAAATDAGATFTL